MERIANRKKTKYIDNPAINNWQKNVRKIKKVIPKSGCKIINPATIINERVKITKYKFLPFIPWTINHEDKIKKKGLINSEGWILMLYNFNQRLEPLTSTPIIGTKARKKKQIMNNTVDILYKFFWFNEEKKIIKKIPIKV